MGVISIELLSQELKDWLTDKIGSLPTRGHDLVLDILNVYSSIAEVIAPYRSGELRDAHRVIMGGLEGSLDNIADHFIFIILGTRPHTIRPVEKMALWWPGALHPVRSVEHPGTSPNDYMQEAFDTGENEVDRLGDEFLEWLVT